MRNKILAVGLVLSLAAIGMFATADICTNPKLGNCQAGGFGVDVASVLASVYADATAVWTFNDPTDLGNQDAGSCASCDLTPQNVPTATGGALGYAADFETGSSQYAERADTADLSVGAGVSWAALAWIRLESDSKYIFSKTEGATGSGDWESFYAVAGDLFCKFHDGTAQRTSQMGTLNAGVRYLVMCRYDATANEWISGIDAVLDSAATATVGDGADTTDKFYIGAQSGVTTMDGIVGPVYWYRSASGGEVPTDAQVTSLYASGKGKLCADLTAAEKVDLVACWDMSENGGPYVDSIGSNDLTGQNTPTRAAGLVERSDSGMGFHSDDSAYFTSSIAGLSLVQNESHTFAWWQFVEVGDGGSKTISVGKAGGLVISSFEDACDWVDVDGGNIRAGSGGAVEGEWEFRVVWWDGSIKTGHLQKNNGTPETATNGKATQASSVAGVEISVGSANGLKGTVDNVAFWRRVLTGDERTTLYNSGAGTFYAAFLDFIFNGPRFAWSQPPVQRRIL